MEQVEKRAIEISSVIDKLTSKIEVLELQKRNQDIEIEQLRQQLRQQEQSKTPKSRDKIAAMSSEVVDSNPYSRLMALKRMGIVENYEVKGK